jgi:hypothetical protein
MDDLAFHRTHFRKAPQNIPHLYQHDTVSDAHKDPKWYNRRPTGTRQMNHTT